MVRDGAQEKHLTRNSVGPVFAAVAVVNGQKLKLESEEVELDVLDAVLFNLHNSPLVAQQENLVFVSR